MRVRTPPPAGMSGGGIWCALFSRKIASGVVFPSPKLVAFQHSHLRESRMLRGVRTEYLLDLIIEHYPKLRGCVSDIKKNQRM
jgi:hypothetical protein